jgi:hypothetical protein
VLARDQDSLSHLREIKRNGKPALTWTTPNGDGTHRWTDARQSFRGLFRGDPLVMQAHQRVMESVRSIYGRFPQLQGLGLTQQRFSEFQGFTRRCATSLSQAALQVRERWYAFADGVKR